nr:isocitrate dehydrogenase [nad] subunit 1, mitochondrial [Quercus suber]
MFCFAISSDCIQSVVTNDRSAHDQNCAEGSCAHPDGSGFTRQLTGSRTSMVYIGTVESEVEDVTCGENGNDKVHMPRKLPVARRLAKAPVGSAAKHTRCKPCDSCSLYVHTHSTPNPTATTTVSDTSMFCSICDNLIRHLQAHQIWRQIHRHTDPRYAGHQSKSRHPMEGAETELEIIQVDVTGVDTGDKHSEELFRESIASLKRNKLGLKGILHTPVERSGHQSFNVALRQELDIYASIVLIKNIPGYETRHKNVDLCIIRENTEGEYSGLEHQSVNGVVESLKIITRAKSERIAKFAFSFALANNRRKVTCIHKANIMKLADGLFRNTVKKVGEEYPTIETNDMIVDNASMQCVSRPQQFDVMVMPNLYGGILSNIGAGLVGGPGIVPGCNMGREVAVFEPGCRHVGLDIKGKDQANPTALILSGSMMLRHLGLDDHANRISKAVYDVIAEGKARTRDMGGNSTTHEFTRAILDSMEKQ